MIDDRAAQSDGKAIEFPTAACCSGQSACPGQSAGWHVASTTATTQPKPVNVAAKQNPEEANLEYDAAESTPTYAAAGCSISRQACSRLTVSTQSSFSSTYYNGAAHCQRNRSDQHLLDGALHAAICQHVHNQYPHCHYHACLSRRLTAGHRSSAAGSRHIHQKQRAKHHLAPLHKVASPGRMHWCASQPASCLGSHSCWVSTKKSTPHS